MRDDQTSRERVRALVLDVLKNAFPVEESSGSGPEPGPEDMPARGRFVPIAPDVAALLAPAEGPPGTRDESAKSVITEDDLRGLSEGATLRIAENARLTPSAADIVRERRIELIRRVPHSGTVAVRTIAIGADHGGFEAKEDLKRDLGAWGHRVRDFGTYTAEAVDYPDIAHAVARAVADGTAELGIIVDSLGIGSAITANKVPGVRAAACYSSAMAQSSREHNGANILTLGSKITSADNLRAIVRGWLTATLKEDRHRKRIAKIEAIERRYSTSNQVQWNK